MPALTRTCPVCGETYSTTFTFQKFCGAKCRRKDRYARTREASIAYSTRWVTQNPGKHRAYRARWRQRNPDKVRAIAAAWRLSNPESGRRASKKWYRANLERVRAAQKAWRESTVEYRRIRLHAWHLPNPEANRLMVARRKALRLGNRDSIGVSRSDWARLLRRYEGRCAYCSRQADELQMDHVIPLSKGGRDAIGNVLPACPSCNLSIGSKFLVVWRYRQRAERG